MKDISVVIGFRNWGIDRLRIAVTSIQNSFGGYDGEVILSDFGSDDAAASQALAEELGIKRVYTAREDKWSRSRALNAGFTAAEGKFLVSTDADMVFSPKSFETIVKRAKGAPWSAFFLQCRDLPEHMTHEWVAQHPDAWEEMEQASRLRPRWGMGGMMAISQEGFERIRGFDERLHTYGGEDLDFAQRARRAGYRTIWIEDPDVRMYHMWHPPTSKVVAETEEGREAVSQNRAVLRNDKTFARNYLSWKYRPDFVRPLVTVSIATKNRADLIKETIQSILFQSVQDFEIIVVDDGGADNLRSVLDSFGDDRIRYFHQEPQGISAARNLALDEARGLYAAVIDDDDLMHPRRLEWHLDALTEGLSGNVGSFLNFDDETGALQLHVSKVPATYTAYEKGSAPGHGTWFIATEVIKKFRYDETITSGVDNNIMLRMLRAGIKLGHTGKPVTLRRMHSRQVTVVDGENQVGTAKDALGFFQFGLDAWHFKKLSELASQEGEWPETTSREELISEGQLFLPDHLTSRDLRIAAITAAEPIDWDGELHATDIVVEGVGKAQSAVVRSATLQDLVRARKAGLSFVVEPPATTRTSSWVEALAEFMRAAVASEDGREFLLFSEAVDPSLAATTYQASVLAGTERKALTVAVVGESELESLPDGAIVVGKKYFGGR